MVVPVRMATYRAAEEAQRRLPLIPATRFECSRQVPCGALLLPGHYLFNFLHSARESARELLVAFRGNQNIVFDTDAESFFRKVNSRLYCDHHTGLQSLVVIEGI